MSAASTQSSWLDNCLARLSQDGFKISENVTFMKYRFNYVAHRSRFEWSKLGNSETFFMFSEANSPDLTSLRAYSSNAFDCANNLRTSSLPCGIFESLWCFPVAIVNAVDPRAGTAIQNEAPVKHWGAAEVPVIFDRTNSELWYYEKTPMWGAAYYSGFRKQIQRYLIG